MKRFLFTIMALGFLLYAPWWATGIVVGAGVFYFPFYIEAIFLGFLFDLLYGVSGGILSGFGMMGLLFAMALYFGVRRLRTNLRYSNHNSFL